MFDSRLWLLQVDELFDLFPILHFQSFIVAVNKIPTGSDSKVLAQFHVLKSAVVTASR